MKAFVSGLAVTVLALGLVVAAPAIAATAPTATTGVAATITASSAIVNAAVNPNGTTTTYVFQYGPTTNYGLQTTTTAAGAGSSSVAVHVTLSGLVSNTTYHFRVVATNPHGTTAGTDATLTTAKTLPTAATGQPSVVKDTSAVVHGTVDPNGKATTYTFQYGPSTTYGLQTAAAAAGAGTTNAAASATLSGLVAGTTYHYRVVATSSDGTAVGADATLLTTGTRVAPTGPLPVVSLGAAVAISAHSVQLNSAINPEGPDTTWYFEIGLTTNYGLQTPSQTMSGLGPRPVNVRLNGLQADSTYHYRLVVFSANRLYVGPDHTFHTKRGARTRPNALAVHASSQRTSSRLTITITGLLQLPDTIAPAGGCNGTVAIEVRRGNATIGLRRASLRSDCSYSLHIYIATNRLHGSTKLGIYGLFAGNALLLPASSTSSLTI